MDYALLARQMRALLEGTGDETASLANASALLNEALGGINWVGFYVAKNGELLLGPFQGKPACVRIPFGAGVCGTAFETNETVRVEDVHEFPGHIACDSASNSEIVIPIRKNGAVVGVLDIDSPTVGRFTKADKEGLERFVKALERELFSASPV